MPRNPNAPAVSYLGMTTREDPNRMEICIDFSGMSGLVHNFGKMLFGRP
jgi:hypothetical protein